LVDDVVSEWKTTATLVQTSYNASKSHVFLEEMLLRSWTASESLSTANTQEAGFPQVDSQWQYIKCA
jgi:hypothetical protein